MKKLILAFILLAGLLVPCVAKNTTYYCTVAGAGTQDGLTPADAFALYPGVTTWFILNAGHGDILYVSSGTYTLTANFSTALDGLATSYVLIIGCSDITTNPPTPAAGDTRPIFAQGAYSIVCDDFWKWENIVASGSIAGYLFTAHNGARLRNCVFDHTSATAGYSALWVGYGEMVVSNCDMKSAKGQAVFGTDYTNGMYINNYAHNSVTGFHTTTGTGLFLKDNIITNCTTGLNLGAGQYSASYYRLTNNTFYKCATGVKLGSLCSREYFLNNIFYSCAIGATATVNISSNFWDYNNWYDNGLDVFNITKGANDIALDPQFTDAPNGNFSVGINMKAKGTPGTFPGLPLTISYTDIGAVQRAEPAGGGGGGGAGFFMMGQ